MDTSFLILFGIREASIMNVIATIGKLVPIVLFIVVMVTAFRWDTFTHDFWGEGTISLSAILGQVKNTMLVTLWVFIGVEGAVVLSEERRIVEMLVRQQYWDLF